MELKKSEIKRITRKQCGKIKKGGKKGKRQKKKKTKL